MEVILTTQEVLRDPVECMGYQQFQVINLFLDTLVRNNSSVGIVRGIASHWEISIDQLEYIFYLERGAIFHNEDLILSEDVLYSFNRHLIKDSASIISVYLKNVLDRISIIDSKSIKFILKGA